MDLVLPQVFETVGNPAIRFKGGIQKPLLSQIAPQATPPVRQSAAGPQVQASQGRSEKTADDPEHPQSSKKPEPSESPAHDVPVDKPQVVDSSLPRFRGIALGAPLAAQIHECKAIWSPSPNDQDTYPCIFLVSAISFRDSLNPLLGGMLHAETYDGAKVGMLSTSFPTGNANDVIKLLTAKYGPPASFQTVPWQSQGGVKTTSAEALWDKGSMLIYVKSPADKISEGSLKVVYRPFLAHTEHEQQKTFKQQTGDL